MRIFSLLLYSLILPLVASSQKIDIGLSFGAANYWGDLSPSVAWSETKPAYSFFGRLIVSKSFALTAQITQTQVSGTDANFDVNKNRNLSFQSNITEFAGLWEFNFKPFGHTVLDHRVTGYVYTGIAGFKFNPTTKLGNNTYVLRDYRTENVNYSTFAWAIPFGIGVKWSFSRNMTLEGQLGFRKTFTDYLDDVSTKYIDTSTDKGDRKALVDPALIMIGGVPAKAGSQRGNADYTDWYMLSTITLAYRLPERSKCARFY